MKSENEIRDVLCEYLWYYNNIIETEDTRGFIEALKWVLDDEDE